MIVVVLTSCPEKLRGYLTRWLMEVSAGVYVGNASRRVREALWERTCELAGQGRAFMAFTTREREQGFEVLTHNHHWVPEDVEGLTLMRRPPADEDPGTTGPSGWSAASRRRRYRRR